MVCRCRCIGIQEFLQSEVFVLSFVQVKGLVVPDDRLFAERRHDELKQGQRFPFEEIWLFNTDSLILSVL